jgi:uncharacterized protein
MLQILLHSSKTMSSQIGIHTPLAMPRFSREAEQLVELWRGVSPKKIAAVMRISESKALEVSKQYEAWSLNKSRQVAAIDAFRGDIYSGLQAASWSEADRKYAHERLIILSGLYGALKACDGILPYRLEMGYKLPDGRSLYSFWGEKVAMSMSSDANCVINLSAVEYTKILLPHIKIPVITPKFLTIHPKTGKPIFVTVHAKIARGAFAHWLIKERIDSSDSIQSFSDLGYSFDKSSSTPAEPVFICKSFEGIGLSVRLK